MIPKGKGIYGRSRFLDDKYAKFLKEHGIEWYVPISTVRLQKQIDVGAKYNIFVHGGDIPHPNRTKTGALAALGVLAKACTDTNAGSMHLDMEEGVFWKADFCRQFILTARSLYRSTIGVTCYGSHKGKLAGMQGADYYLDQVYDRGRVETVDQVKMFQNSLAKFTVQGLQPLAIGIGAFLNYKNADGTKVTTVKPIERFKRHIAGCPKTFAVAVWTLPSFQTNPEKYKEHWKAIGDWRL